MTITWLNQGGFLFETLAGRLVVDAYLSDVLERQEGLTRLAEPSLTLEELRPDYWLCTHDHKDHFDSPTVASAIDKFPACKFIGPRSVQRHLSKLGLSEDRIIPLCKAQNVSLGGLKLAATPAEHSDPEAIGVLIEDAKFRIYLSGDTEFFVNPEYVANQIGHADMMLICINGKWGNMDSSQAVEMAKLVRPGVAVPMHYGLFAENTVEPDGFLSECKDSGIKAVALQAGCKYQIEELLK